ncbi:MAG TPA: hypothetical protein P5572_19940, partial [Phycisphaerae bacterium]|nr:hypothetical protein [Phycisphaerae bacterium]
MATRADLRRSRSRLAPRLLAVALGALTLGAAGTAYCLAADASTLSEYQHRFQSLAANDVEGHVKLALWCRDQEAWDLLVKQSTYVLSLEPDHRLAKLLLDLGKSKMGTAPAEPADTGGGSPTPAPTTPAGTATATGKSGLLTPEQVQVLRRKELRLDGSEHVRVTLKNKVDERFLNYLTAREGLSNQDVVAFKRLNPLQKAVVILGRVRMWERAALATGDFQDEFSDDVIIEDDPLIFKEYITRVWPIIARGCATSGCHSGPQGAEPVLYNERRMSDEMHYTNYLILDDFTAGDAHMINRDFPKDSLLLVYGQPVAGNQSTVHPTEIRPIYQSPTDRNYITVGRW